MKNKKGFTLIEVTISITLLSLVMIFMLRFITIIRKDENSINSNTEMLLNKTLISKTINKDIRESGGINSLSCTNNKCTINLKDNSKKILEISSDQRKLTYKDETDNKILLTKKLNENFKMSINKTETEDIYLLEIIIDSHEEYNIEIVDNKI